jgi:hypothetical protein
VERDGKSLLKWIRIHSLRGLPGLAGPELGFLRTSTASVLRNDACLRLPARNRKLHKAGLKLDIEKSEFAFSEVKYLGFIISAGEGIKIDPGKIKAIKKWEASTTVKGVRSFIGFSNFYRGFIKNFSEVAAPLMLLTRKN